VIRLMLTKWMLLHAGERLMLTKWMMLHVGDKIDVD
jgi:hypothetical protein